MIMNISIIAAVAINGAIGYKGRLPWHIPEDLAHFKALTLHHTVLMGRATFESLPNGALKDRKDIVLSTQSSSYPNAEVFPSVKEALDSCQEDEEVFIIGGEQVYRETIDLATTLYLTMIEQQPDADAFFPSWDKSQWLLTKEEKHCGFSFVEYHRIR